MTIIGIILFILCIALHELGHAFYMKKNGIAIQEISLFGITGKRLFTFKWRKMFGEIPITFRLIPLGAYVRPTDYGSKRSECLPLSKYGEILGAGVAVNFLFGVILSGIALYFKNGFLNSSFLWQFSAAILILLFLRYTFYLIPVIGLLIACVILNNIFSSPTEFVKGAGGIVVISKSINEHSNDFLELLEYCGAISIGVGLMNCLPFAGLDGGKITSKILERVFYNQRRGVKKYFMIATLAPILLLILLAIGGDLVSIFKMIF